MLRAVLLFLLCLQTLVWGGGGIVVGFQNNGTNNQAALWIGDLKENAQPILLDNSGGDSLAREVTSIGDQLYITGYATINGTRLATLWITDFFGNKQKTTILGPENVESFGRSIISLGNKLYIAGDQNAIAHLWSLDLAGNLLASTPFGQPGTTSTAIKFISLGDTLYIAGQQNAKAFLWILQLDGDLQAGVIVGAPSGDSNGFSVLSLGHTLYLTGLQREGLTDTIALLWMLNLDGSTRNMTRLSPTGMKSLAAPISSLSNKLYIIGRKNYDLGVNKGALTLWICNLNGDILDTITVADISAQAAAFSSTILEKKLFISGEERVSGVDVATVWVRNADGSYNNKIHLGHPNLTSSALCIYFPSKGPQMLENAFKTFSPLKYLKGS